MQFRTSIDDTTPMARKIMLIEDEELFVDLFQEIFSRAGYDITCVTRGALALDYPRYDLYIVDLKLPGMSGLETLEALAKKFQQPVPSIIITGYEPLLDQETRRRCGILEVLQKPFDLDHLKALIHDFFASSSS